MANLLNLIRFFFKELVHKRIFLVVVVIGLSFVVLSLLLGPLSFAEEKRLSINFSLAGSQVALIFLSVLVGANFLKSDIDSKSIHALLARPISRSQYYLAKFFAFLFCLVLLTIGMWGVFLIAAYSVGFRGIFVSFIPFIGILIESLFLFCFAMLLSLFSSSFLAIGAAFSLFLVGHWVQTFEYLVKNSASALVKGVGYVFMWIVPNLESLNWKSHLTYNEWLSFGDYLQFSAYGLTWIVCLLSFGIYVFSQKDFA